MPSRHLDFPTFDADNHMYETKEALTKFLPEAYAGVIDYVEVKGRTKITVKGKISDYIPNPTFDRVAAPGAQEEYFKVGNPDGKSRLDIMGKAIDAPAAFREPGPRLELMDEDNGPEDRSWLLPYKRDPFLAKAATECRAVRPSAADLACFIQAKDQHAFATCSPDYKMFK